MSTADVELLDLRGRAAPVDVPWAPRLVVLDTAGELAAHDPHWAQILGDRRVGHVLAVIVGDVPFDLPSALRGKRAILWVGDGAGVSWEPEANRIGPPGDDNGLAGLLAVLGAGAVFDAVRQRLDDAGVACPGLRQVVTTVAADELAVAGREALARVRERRGGAPTGFTAALATTARADGDIRLAAVEYRAALDALADLDADARAVSRPAAIVGRARPGARLGPGLDRARRAAQQHHAQLHHTLDAMNGALLHPDRQASLIAAGIPEPDRAAEAELVRVCADRVDRELVSTGSVSTAADRARSAALVIAPQGVRRAVVALEHERPGDPQAPVFGRALPFWLVTVSLVSGFAAAWVPGPAAVRIAAGVAVVLAWLAVCWVLAARRPAPAGEAGPGAAAGPALSFALAAAAGAGGGFALAAAIRIGVPPVVGWIGLACALVLLGVVPVLCWREAARGWADVLPLDRLRAAVEGADRVGRDALAEDWLPSERRRVLSEHLSGVANALDAVAARLPAVGADHEPGAAPRHVVARPELVDVVAGDLVDLSRAALRPHWGVLSRDPAPATGEADRLGMAYVVHVAEHGTDVAPPFAMGSADRAALAAALWASTPVADAVRAGPQEEMRQFCRYDQLDVLRAEQAGSVPPVRFAPSGVDVGPQVGDVVRTASAGRAGTLRLVPLRSGQVGTGAAERSGAAGARDAAW